MTFQNKIKLILGILMIFALIVVTNRIDKKNFVKIKDSVVTIYNDRLIADDLILEILKSIHKKELAVVSHDTAFFTQNNIKVNEEIQLVIEEFKRTKLTEEETVVFKDLRDNLDRLSEVELAFAESEFIEKSEVESQLTKLKEILYDLTRIQLDEGSRQLSISQKAMDTVDLFTQIEINLLLFLAIIIQIIIVYKPREAA